MKRKFKFFLSLEKEERWLNNQLNKGWGLVSSSMGYKFKPFNSANKIIQIDYRAFNTKEEFENYVLFMSDTGWEHIRGSKNSGKHYFIGSLSQNREIFSDTESKIEREKRNRNALIGSFGLAICYFILDINSKSTAVNSSILLNPKQTFLTPGLWTLNGKAFISAFLFELPFALGRLLAVAAPPLIAVILAILIIQRQLTIYRYQNRGN